MDMDNINIEEVNGLYRISDETDGGYVTRVSRYTCHWVTIWSKDVELLEFYFNHEERTPLLKDVGDFDHHRAIRTRGRHKKALQIHLGLVEKKMPPVKETILYYPVGLRWDDKILKKDVVIHDKTIDIGHSVKKNSLKYTLATEDKIQLAEEYNRKYEEFEKYKKDVFDKLFTGEK